MASLSLQLSGAFHAAVEACLAIPLQIWNEGILATSGCGIRELNALGLASQADTFRVLSQVLSRTEFPLSTVIPSTITSGLASLLPSLLSESSTPWDHVPQINYSTQALLLGGPKQNH